MNNQCHVNSLLNRTIDYIVCNMGVYMRNNPVVLANLPMQIKNRILRKFTVSMHFLKGLDVTNTLPLFLHSRTKRVDLTCLTIDDNILQTLQPCLYLEEVFLTRKGVHSATSQGLIDFFTNKHKIYVLTLSYCAGVNDDVIQTVTKNCCNLAALDLDGCENITDKALEAIASMKNLKWIALSNTKISNSGIKLLTEGESANKIKELRIANCPNITCDVLGSIALNCPDLEVLEFHNSSNMTSDVTALSVLHENTLKKLKQLTWTITW